MKKILILLLTFGLFNCNNPLKKTIFEPLTVNELKEAIDRDTSFKNTYEYIVYIRDTVLKKDLEKAKYADLTYGQINDFAKFSSDTIYFKPINKRIEKEWEEKYGVYRIKADSISEYWKKYKEENSLNQYVKVELAAIDKEYYSYSGSIRNVNLGFRLIPLKGKIDQMRFAYRIEAKINERDDTESYSSLYSALDKSWCLTTNPFSEPVTRYWEADYSNEKILKGKTLETFKRDYNINIEIDEIRKDGVNMSTDDLNIPKAVMNYWEYENKEYLSDFYIGDIIREALGKEYLRQYEYRNQEIDKILKERDPLVYDFIKEPLSLEELE